MLDGNTIQLTEGVRSLADYHQGYLAGTARDESSRARGFMLKMAVDAHEDARWWMMIQIRSSRTLGEDACLRPFPNGFLFKTRTIEPNGL